MEVLNAHLNAFVETRLHDVFLFTFSIWESPARQLNELIWLA